MESVMINRQSSIRLSGEKTVYFDPWDIKGFAADADVIFITHDHFDHYVKADIQRLMKQGTVVIAPATMAFQVQQETGAQVMAVEPGKAYTANGVSFTTVASYNMNKDFHPRKAGWCGYVVQWNGQRWYVTGDMDATPEAAAVKCDVLLLPIGGYYTMDYQEAASLTAQIAPAVVIPTHYGDVVGEKNFGEKFAALLAEKAPRTHVELILYR